MDSLSTNFVNFSSFLGLPMEWFEKEISSLLKKLELRKGCGVKVSGRKRSTPSTSHFEQKIHKLECSVNYNKSPATVRGRSFGAQNLFCEDGREVWFVFGLRGGSAFLGLVG